MNELDFLNTELAKELAKQLGKKLFNWIPEPIYEKRILKKQISESKRNLAKLMLECGFSLEEAQTHNRLIEREKQRRVNYSSIINLAAESNIDPLLINNIDLDWLNQHYEKASLYSNIDLQKIWAGILAGEIMQPGSYSKQVLSIVDIISPIEAKTFQKLLSFLFYINDTPHIIFHSKNIFQEINTGFTYLDLIQLQGLGLISIDSSVFGSGYNPNLEYDNDKLVICRYHQKKFTIKPINSNRKYFYIRDGIINLTNPGLELLRICKSKENDVIFSNCIKYWNENGHQVSMSS